MRALSLVSLVIVLAIVGWMAKRQLGSSVAVPQVVVPADGATSPGDTAAKRVPVTQVPQQVQGQLEALGRQQSQRPDPDAAAAPAEGGKP